MPLYEYQCKECGIRFERTQSFNDAPLTTCPECEGEVYRVIGATGVIFKGSGFYVTDNRKSSSGSSGHHTHTKSEESGAESKPAEKSATPSAEKASTEKTSTEKSSTSSD